MGSALKKYLVSISTYSYKIYYVLKRKSISITVLCQNNLGKKTEGYSEGTAKPIVTRTP